MRDVVPMAARSISLELPVVYGVLPPVNDLLILKSLTHHLQGCRDILEYLAYLSVALV
jgi:hypothetical protein